MFTILSSAPSASANTSCEFGGLLIHVIGKTHPDLCEQVEFVQSLSLFQHLCYCLRTLTVTIDSRSHSVMLYAKLERVLFSDSQFSPHLSNFGPRRGLPKIIWK